MKLRNKKTGEIFELDKLPKWLKETIQLTASFYSRECEVYEPKEPFIKDPKIRKAVRAWAEANSIDKIIIFDCINDSPYVHAGEVKFAEFGGHFDIRFRTDEKINTDKIYTLTELCGDE